MMCFLLAPGRNSYLSMNGLLVSYMPLAHMRFSF